VEPLAGAGNSAPQACLNGSEQIALHLGSEIVDFSMKLLLLPSSLSRGWR